jgi:Putative Zn-dependent protease, contains TPR repeats
MQRKGYLIILISILFIGCYNGVVCNEKLLQAEMLVDTLPKLALDILQDTIDPDILTKAEFANWCLLVTKAKDKLYIKHKSDSLINIAVNYYSKKGNSEELMEAYYHAGRVSNDLGNVLQAQDYYLKALVIGKKSENFATLARINNELGSLYLLQRVYAKVLFHYNEAQKKLELVGDESGQSFVLRNIGRIYTMENKIDSAISFYKRALAYSNDRNLESIVNELGNTYLLKKQYDEAYNYFQESNRRHPNIISPYNWVVYFNHKGKLDSVEYYAKKMILDKSIEKRKTGYEYLYDIKKRKRDIRSALFSLEQYKLLSETIDKTKYTESIAYYKNEKEANDRKLRNSEGQNRAYQYLLLIILLSIALLSLIFWSTKRRRSWKKHELMMNEHFEKLKKENASLILENEEKIKQLKRHFEEKENEDKELVDSKIKMLVLENEKLFYADREKKLLIDKFRETEIYQKFHSPDFKMTSQDKKELMNAIDEAYPDFYVNIHEFYSKMKEDELFMCVLFKTEIKQLKTIGKYMNLTTQAITMKRDRLYEKIFKHRGDAKLFDEFIKSL